jgi:RND family efflux transporter MFP subunit
MNLPTLSSALLPTVAGCSLLLVGCGRSDVDTGAKAETPPPKVTVVTPLVRKTVDWDEFTGRLASPETVEIRSRVTGYLDEVHFAEGAEIEENALLFTIDPRPYQAVVDRMDARVTSARSREELAAKELENVMNLQDNGSISAEDFDRRAKAASDAVGMLKAAEAELRAAKLDLEFTEIRSPIKGRVSDARITKGNLVTSEGQESTLLTTVVSLDPIYCYIDADERSVLKYRELHREGKRVSAQFGRVEAEMELAHESGFPHKGYIDFVDNVLDPATGTIRARAVVPNPDKLMAPGFFARVRVPGSGEYEGLLVPDRAIADDQGTSHVWVIDGENTAVYRKVSTGPLLDGLRIIREGLAPGERVVVDGIMTVRNGQKVDPRPLAAAEQPAPATAK